MILQATECVKNGEFKSKDLLNSILEKTRVIKGVEKATALVYDDEKKYFTIKATSGYKITDLTDVHLTMEEAYERYEKNAEKISNISISIL